MMRILLAPMEGLLDYMLRDILTQTGGYDLCVSEFIRITDTLLATRSFYRIVPELQQQCRTPAGIPVRVQILGSDPICMAENAAKLASLDAYGIDINFGCPAPTVNRHRGGAALLKEPELMHDIMLQVRKTLPATVPLTAKMRLGYDTPDRALECAQALQDGGAQEIAVHARTKSDGYKPPAYWEWIARIREQLSIPVVANGEIWNAQDAQRCRQISGCEDIMIGRGAVANPALALMIRNEKTELLSWDEMLPLLFNYWQIINAHIDAKHRGGRLKQWLHYLTRHYPEAETAFALIKRLTVPADIERAMFASFTT